MYLLEYGAGCCPDNVGSGRLVRIDNTQEDSNRVPEVNMQADKTSGSLPLTIHFSSDGTTDSDGDALLYEWDFESNGSVDSEEKNPSVTYTEAGIYRVQLRVNDSNGGINSKSLTIHAGNNAATFEFIYPPDGGMMHWEDNLNYHITVHDQEDGSTADGTIDCSKIKLVPSIGHLDHFHDMLDINKCKGSFFIDPAGHDAEGEQDIFMVFNVNYTDENDLTSFGQIRLHPKLMEAEFFDKAYQTFNVKNTDPLGGGSYAVRALSHNSYLMFEERNLLNIQSVSYRIASTSGGTIELHSGAVDGALLSSVEIPSTGSLNEWVSIEAPITDPGGKHDLFFVFKNPSGNNLFDLNYIEFKGNGVTVDNTPPSISSLEALSKSQLSVKFNEQVNKSSAEQTTHYAINPEISIVSATLQNDGRTVLLETTPIAAQQSYTLTVINVENVNGNIITQPHRENFTLEIPATRINAGGEEFSSESGMDFTAD